MTDKKVLIITIPPQDTTRPPGILAVLAGCCESINIDYDILDLNLYMHKQFTAEIAKQLTSDFLLSNFRSIENENHYNCVSEHLVEKIKEYKPTHIAISVFTYVNILAADALLKYIKSANLKIPFSIVIGGVGVNNTLPRLTDTKVFGQYCLDNNLVDYCIYGEGEISFVKLLEGQVDFPGINKPTHQQILDLDTIPKISYKRINAYDYFFADEPEVLVTGSKGCVRDCSFCDVAHYWGKYVYKSGDNIANELFDIWKTTGIRKFDFSDSLINGSIKSFRRLNRRLIELKKENPGFDPKYRGQFICRPSGQLTEQDYIEMTQAGAETLIVGIESFSNEVRDHIGKKFNNDSIDWHFEMSARLGIKNVLLILAGYVTETDKDHQTNLQYLKKYQIYALSRTIYAVNIEIGGLMVLQGTPLYDMIDDLGIILHPVEKTQWTILTNPSLTPIERLRRAVELVDVAYSLGYKVLHYNQKVDQAERIYAELKKNKDYPLFEIKLAR